MDLTRVTVFCFSASYLVALAAESIGLFARQRGWVLGSRRAVAIGFTMAGAIAHAVYLSLRARGQATPLSSPQDWYLLAALALVAVYLAALFNARRWTLGLFLLPAVLALIGVSRTASAEPFTAERASFFWGQAHGWLLLTATVAVTLGFLFGVMQLVQDRRLKAKLPPTAGFALPSLEWLEAAGSRAAIVSAWAVGGGFASGLVLTTLKVLARQPSANAAYSVWTDPVVLALGILLAWLIAAVVWRSRQAAAGHGANSAWLAVASFVLMAVTLSTVTLLGAAHGPAARGTPSGPPPSGLSVPAVDAGPVG
ncbi:hypothetical protein [Botrimarina hoheduenensis]|uniref:Cytochrome C assembly protein n=1 Tax=Botrimarina hoheduenensis TaxID=2528000 RepID=A0A5C5WA07_9BACT|nr:hypothetical protein [Botrimarina hoheduenensis]TWT46861.1 hypothetical protein Pla111_19630 [Botrimarina hoheduenensis]